MAEVTKEDEALVDELCEMHNAGHAYNEYMVHDLNYAERCQRIAAYREQCEQAARDEVVKRVRSAACKDCKAGVKLDSGWRGGSWFHVGNVPGYKVWRCPIDPKIHEALDPDGRLAGGAK